VELPLVVNGRGKYHDSGNGTMADYNMRVVDAMGGKDVLIE